jgi:hypothetical protein
MTIISLKKAKQMIADGTAVCDGRTQFDEFGRAHLIITSAQHVDHVSIDDSLDLTGLIAE